jgi:hypothetical protein
MATMYNITIKEINKNELTTEVTFIHPDAGEMIGSKDFALQIICYTSVDLNWKELVTSKEDWKNLIENHPQKDKLAELNGYLFGKRIYIEEEEYKSISIENNDELKRNLERKYQTRFDTFGAENGAYYILSKMNVADFTDEAESIILNDPQVTDSDSNTKTLKFSVSDASLLAHIKSGMSYDTAAFSIVDYYF